MFSNFSYHQELQILTQDLRHFGLNPQDWRLVRENSRHYRIESLTEDNFIFVGRVFKKGTKLSWDQLSLIEV